MSHYTIDYAETETDKKDEKAIADIIEYLGKDRYSTLVNATRTTHKDLHMMDILLHFVGIQGFPVFAFMRKHYSADDYSNWLQSLSE